MGDKLGKMVRVSYLILVIFFLNISAELDKVSIKPISPENISIEISQKEKKFIDQYVSDITSSYNFDY